MKCPICEAETVRKFRPFCSKSCKDRDLIQWLSGGYRIVVAEDDMDHQALQRNKEQREA